MYRQSEKKLLNSNISPTSSFQPTIGWDWFVSLGDPSKFQRVSCLGFATAATSVNGGRRDFARCLASPGLVHYIHFWGALAPNRILPGAKFTLHPSLAFFYIGSITAWHSAVSVCQTLSHGTKNGITELSLLVIFNRGRHL